MPRSVVNNSDEDYERKPASKAPRTRAAAAASVSDSPLRRSTRIRHGSVNPDGSSPESVEETTTTLVRRTTRRRAIAAPEPTRNLRSRRNSVSSSISENPEPESAPGTPRAGTRSTKHNLQQDTTPDTPKPIFRTRRSIRAVSESKSPPSVGRVTRRTRASSIEPNIEHATKSAAALIQHATSLPSTPSKRRRTQVSVVPSEPVLNEEINEDKADSKTENEWAINEETEVASSPEKKSTKSATADGGIRKSSESSLSVTSSPSNKSVNEKTRESEYQLESSRQIETAESSPTNLKVENSIKLSQSSSSQKKKRHSLDTSKELGRKIENLLNKSTEEQEQSPGNKENQKLNVSPEKIKKNLGFTVSNVNIVRESKSVGSALFVRNSDEKKLNASLDERVLSKSWHDTSVLKSITVEDGKSINAIANASGSTSEEKTQKEISDVEFSNTTQNESILQEDGNQLPRKHQVVRDEDSEFTSVKTSCRRLDETGGENEILEEFSLYDSNDSNQSLDLKKDAFNSAAKNHTPEEKSETNDAIFEKPILPSRRSRKSSSDVIEKKQRDMQTRRFSLSLERIDNVGKFTTKSLSKTSSNENNDSLSTPESQVKQSKRRQSAGKKNTSDQETDKTNTSPSKNDSPLNSNIETHGNISSQKNPNEDESFGAEQCREIEKQLAREKDSPSKRRSKQLELGAREKQQLSERNSQNIVSDSDASIGIADLFQDISADEWNKKVKKDILKASPAKTDSTPKKKKVSNTLPMFESKNETDSEEDLVLEMDSSWGKNLTNKDNSKHNVASDSDETVIVEKNISHQKADKKRKSTSKKITEKSEDEDVEMEEMKEATHTEKSVGQSLNSNPSVDCEISDEAKEESNRKSVATSQEEDVEMQEISSDAETIPASIAEEEIGGEKETLTSRKSQRDRKRKSESKTPTKSINVYKFNENSEDEKSDKAFDEDSDEDLKQAVESLNKTSPATRTPVMSRSHLSRNYSIVAVVDSDSRSDNLDDSEEASSDDNFALTGSLFNTQSSDDEANSNQDNDHSNNTIDPDVAKELNLAGDDDIEYSDENIAADECRASESEQSDEGDDGSDLEGFIVADDAVESSEASEDEVTEEEKASVKSKYRRILNKSSSEDEGESEEEGENEEEEEHEEDEENEEDGEIKKIDNQRETERTDTKSKRKSDHSAAVYRRQVRSEELITKSPEISGGPEKLNFSLNRNETSSGKKIRKKKVIQDLGEVERTASPRVEDLEKSVPKKKHPKIESTLLHTTIDLCTPEQNSSTEVDDQNMSQSSSLDNSVSKKSAKKLKQKNLVEELATSPPNTTDLMEEGNKLGTPDTNTSKSEKKTPKEKTPKLKNKNQRDSIQIIRESEVLKAKVSDLNLSVQTPNSESPVTKFLMKEKLNESLPLLELNKKVKKLFDKEGLSKMKEEELVDNDASEIDEDEGNEDDAEESNIEDNDMNDEVQEAGNELNGNHEDDKGEDETDEEFDKFELNGNKDGESDNEDEDEEEEDSANDEVFESEKNRSVTEVTERPETRMLEKRQKSTSKKLELEPEPEESVISQDEKSITSNEKAQKKASTTSTMNGGGENSSEDSNEDEDSSKKSRKSLNESTARKKRARLESSETPRTPQVTKKMKLLSKTGESQQEDSDSDEAPDSIGFREARTEALQAMKDVATSLKAAKEAKKKKKQDQLERVRQEREVKVGKKSASKEPVTNRLKRLPDDLLDDLSDLPQRPQKKQKLSKKSEVILPSKQMFAPGEPLKSSIHIDSHASPLSTAGGTTQFSVVNLQKVKKRPPKLAAVASFREQMLARNPRQPVSAFLMYQAKQKASGKHLLSRK